MDEFSDGATIFAPKNNSGAIKREWVGLTDEDFADMVVITLDDNGTKFDSHVFAKYIEAKLREKNT